MTGESGEVAQFADGGLKTALPWLGAAFETVEAALPLAEPTLQDPEFRQNRWLLRAIDLHRYNRQKGTPGPQIAPEVAQDIESNYRLAVVTEEIFWPQYTHAESAADFLQHFHEVIAIRLLNARNRHSLQQRTPFVAPPIISGSRLIGQISRAGRQFPDATTHIEDGVVTCISRLSESLRETPMSPGDQWSVSTTVDWFRRWTVEELEATEPIRKRLTIRPVRRQAQIDSAGGARDVEFGLHDQENLDFYFERLQIHGERLQANQVSSNLIHRSVMDQLITTGIRLIKDTLAITAPDNENARKMLQFIEQSGVNIPNSTARAVPLSAIVQMANSVTPLLNDLSRATDEPVERPQLESSVYSLPEAFRRLMLVVFNGVEAEDLVTTQLNLPTRFACIDLLAELIAAHSERRTNKYARNNRGVIQGRGQQYWRRWTPGYGLIT